MSIVSTAKMTAKQFLELGEDPVGIRLELVDGEVAVSPSPTPSHSYTEKRLSIILGVHIQNKKLGRLYGDVDTIFGPYDVRRPDLIYFSKRRLDMVGEKAMEGPPDLCVEIVSPSSRLIDRRDKFRQYAKGKVANYWIVDPDERTIQALKLTKKGYREVGACGGNEIVSLPPFADLQIPLGQIWHPVRGR